MKSGIIARGFFCLVAMAFQVSLEGASSATAIDPTFQPVTLEPGAYGLAGASAEVLQPDGNILIVGVFSAVNGERRFNFARLQPDGSLDEAFIPATPTNGYVRSVAVQGNGKILVVVAGQPAPVIRLNPDGTLDASFKVVTDTL